MKSVLRRCSLICALVLIGATAYAAAAETPPAQSAKAGFDIAGEVFSWGMSPLWVCSFLLVAFVFERFRSLRPERVIDQQLVQDVCALVVKGRIDEAQQECAFSPTLIGQAWAQGLTEFRLGGTTMIEALTTATALHLKPLKRNLVGIATIAVICPLFGLLGTVIGMIMTFSHISSTAGVSNKAAVASGIAFALVKTAGGLVVAIPAIVMGRYFQSRLIGLADQAEAAINRVNHRYIHGQANPTEADDAKVDLDIHLVAGI